MKVILLKDVPKVGRKLTAVEVADGYAANFLFPKRLAEPATATKLAELAKRQESARAAEDARLEDLREKLAALAEDTVTLAVKADDKGHLFKKVRASDIVALLADEHGIVLDEEAVLLEEPINEVGEYEIPLEVAGAKTALTLTLVAE